MKQEGESQRKRHQLSDPNTYRHVHPFAKLNRRALTLAEEKLWSYLRNRQVSGFKFRRQHVIDRYVVDFVCIEAKLIVEVDGDIHLEGNHPQRDAERTRDLEDEGFRVIRFTNDDVLGMTLLVIDQIREALLRSST
jgi:very-short-patch-repair endonuclease